MNILHLKYAVEVEQTRSITKAADRLFMGQPNLSRAIKELEENLGITIFKRTSKGMIPTQQGEIFLSYARGILKQIDELESIYKNEKQNKLTFSISIPRASYITDAFTRFVAKLDPKNEFEFNYKETNNVRAIGNILQNNYHLGIIRYQSAHEDSFVNLLTEKDLHFETILEFEHFLLFPNTHPLAKKEQILQEDLRDYIEITHGDPYVPSLPFTEVRKAEFSDTVSKRIFIYERGSQFELLHRVPSAYVWVSPTPAEVLKRNNLVQRQCVDGNRKYKDVLIYKHNYKFNYADKLFISELDAVKREICTK